ncbi:MAG: phosphatidylserine decarboxylase family protein [Bacteroidales bacterium]|jgi:phosphatidylserine decarboxylase|nr:phosphatidylserine decarboxylase family protein [Bacteroidales bacterium]
MRIHKEVKRSFAVATFVLIGLCILCLCLLPQHCLTVGIAFLCIAVLVLGFILRFFRIPSRVVNICENGVISPADGTVIAIEEVVEEECFKENRIKISIFMSVFNVHVNFHPISGTVTYVKYHPGKYLIASLPKASTDNEHNSVVITNEAGVPVLYRQIAGLVARRIVCHLQEGMPAVQGEEMGMIRFGSRVDVFLPLDAETIVNVGDKVTAQKSVVAYL